jgi:alpha-methylacyl-CoA racemase
VSGPLAGVRVIELGGIGPVPLAAMLLADLGAEVVRVDRVDAEATGVWDVPLRGRRNIAVDLRHPHGVATVLDLVERADVLLEGFRPGVAERLGIGPEPCHARNPRLVYGRMTGWGRDGPLAQAAGHDLNYIALAGALAHFGRPDGRPSPPLNLVGDYAGGTMFLLLGVVSALYERAASGLGQVVDAAMVDGVATLMSMWWGFAHAGRFDERGRGTHHFDTGAHFFEVYECADGEHVAVAAIEPQFYAELLRRLGLDEDPTFAIQRNRQQWPQQKARLAEVFATRTRDEWCAVLEGTDACFAPVLRLSEFAAHPHTVARRTIVEVEGVRQPAPAPRFSRTVAELGRPPGEPGQDTCAVLLDWGVAAARVNELVESGAVAQRPAGPAAM